MRSPIDYCLPYTTMECKEDKQNNECVYEQKAGTRMRGTTHDHGHVHHMEIYPKRG
jgi:hypothetical protein